MRCTLPGGSTTQGNTIHYRREKKEIQDLKKKITAITRNDIKPLYYWKGHKHVLGKNTLYEKGLGNSRKLQIT